MWNAYTAKPTHLTYVVILLVIGTYCFTVSGWELLGLGLWVLAAIVTAWIVIAGIMAERSRYWEAVADALNAASKNDIEKLAALGFTHDELPGSLHVDMRTDDITSRHFELPVSAVKLAPLASGLLNGQPFSERRWVDDRGLFSADEFRRLRGVLRDRGLIEPVNEKDNRQGFKLTPAGYELMREILPYPTAAND